MPLEDVLQRKQSLIQGVIRAMLFNQLKRNFDLDLLSSLGLQDVEFWGKGFAYIPSEEAAVRVHGCKDWQGLLADHALLVGSSFSSDNLSPSMPFSRVAAQQFLPGWVTRESITITCITCSCSLSSSALWSVDNAVLTSLIHISFPLPALSVYSIMLEENLIPKLETSPCAAPLLLTFFKVTKTACVL